MFQIVIKCSIYMLNGLVSTMMTLCSTTTSLSRHRTIDPSTFLYLPEMGVRCELLKQTI